MPLGAPSLAGAPPTPHPRSSSREPTAAWARARVPPARTASPARSPPSRAAAARQSWAPAPRVPRRGPTHLPDPPLRARRAPLPARPRRGPRRTPRAGPGRPAPAASSPSVR